MSKIRNRLFTEYGSTRAPAPFGQKRAKDSHNSSAAGQSRNAMDRKVPRERDELAWSAVLGYN
jgi:hypothetical protein